MIVSDVLTHATERAERQLDRMADRLPEIKEARMPFGEYLARATEYAKTDEKFARRLAQSLQQYQRLGR